MSEKALLVVVGRQAFLCPEDRHAQGVPVPVPLLQGPDEARTAQALLGLLNGTRSSPGSLQALAAQLPEGSGAIRVGDRAARTLVESLGRRAEEAPARLVAAARERLLPRGSPPERELLLAVAREALEERLASPEEVVISLAREAERLDRLVRREKEALGALAAGSTRGTAVSAYVARTDSYVGIVEERRRELDRALEQAILRILPNTSAVVGARTAGRLLALAGSPVNLLRMPASRIQILGARRRRPGSPGPRHGSIYGAEGMERVPPGRRGALARSMASWAAIALRADLLTHGSVGLALVERRERRIAALAKAWRPRPPPTAPPAPVPAVEEHPPPRRTRRESSGRLRP